MTKRKKSFTEKYNLENEGKPVKITEKTKEITKSLFRKAEEVNEKGQEYSRLETRLFGGCPQPGEPGSENFFTML